VKKTEILWQCTKNGFFYDFVQRKEFFSFEAITGFLIFIYEPF